MSSTGSSFASRRPTLATFGLMVTAIVGGGVLALPTALARFGPINAALLVFALGIVNVVTLAALAGAVARSTAAASGRGLQGVLTEEHLGPVASVSATGASLLEWFGVLCAYVLGTSTSLSELFFGEPWMWAVVSVAFVTALVGFQARQLLIASAIAVAVASLAVFAVMFVIIGVNIEWELLTAGAPTVEDDGVNPLQLVFGTVLLSYFGHTAIFSIAPEVLRADPTGRSLRRGAIAAMCTATVVNVGWIVVSFGAVGSERFLTEASTGVKLLVDVVGPILTPLTTAFVLLAMGVSAVNCGFVVQGLIAERLPSLRQISTVLRPGASVVADDPSSGAALTITALTSDDGSVQLIARARRDREVAREVIATDSQDLTPLLRSVGVDRRRSWVRVTVSGEVLGGIAVRVDSSLPLAERSLGGQGAALLAAVGEDVADRIVVAAVREPGPVEVIADRIGVDRATVQREVDLLIGAGRLRAEFDGTLRASLGHRHRAKAALVTGLLDELVGTDDAMSTPLRETGWLGSEAVRRAITTVPVASSLAVVLVLLVTGASFTAVLSLISMGTVVFLGGALPLLLGMSLRRRAERRVSESRLLGSSLLATLLFGFMIVSALYAVVIYQSILERSVALAALAVIVASTISAVRRRSFADRSTLLIDLGEDGSLSVTALTGGQPVRVHAPTSLGHDENELVIDVPDGLPSPVLLLAVDGEVLPARLGAYRLTTADGSEIVGRLEDLAGDLVSPGEGALRCRWSLR